MSKRLSFQSSIDCSDIFTEEFQNLLVKLHEKFNNEVSEIRKEEEVSPTVLPPDFLPKDLKQKDDYSKEKTIKKKTIIIKAF